MTRPRLFIAAALVAIVAGVVMSRTGSWMEAGEKPGAAAPVRAGFVWESEGNVPADLVFDDERDGVWSLIGGAETRASFYDVKTGREKHWGLGYQLFGTESGLALGDAGIVWIGIGNTLTRLDVETSQTQAIGLPEVKYPLSGSPGPTEVQSNHDIRAVAVDQQGMIWMTRARATSLTGYDPASGQFSEVPLPDNLGDGRSLLRAKDGLLWLTSGGTIPTGRST